MTTDWLDIDAAPAACNSLPPGAPPQVERDEGGADEGWLDIQDPHAHEVTAKFRFLVDACMRGTNRVMACDGNYLAYRPYNREFDKEVNPRTAERFASFCAAGHYKHIGTYDEVQIFELLDGSPFKHKGSYVAGQDYWRDIRQAAKLACERKWADYHDYLGAMASAIKGGGRDPVFAATMWNDTLNQVAIQIKHYGGPEEREVNEGFTGVRKQRGISKGGVLATLDSSKLERVGFG